MTQLKFPGGQVVDVQFDEVQHSYVVAHQLADGKFTETRPVNGVTKPLEVIPKGFLVPWGSKMGAEGVVQAFTDHPEFVENLGDFWADKLAMEENHRTPDDKPVMSIYKFKKKYPWFSEAKAMYKEKSKEGKEIGSWIHSAIEIFYKSGRKTKPKLDDFTRPIWESFIMFDNFFKPTPDPDGLEFLVYSLQFGYSGQGDFRGRMSGKHCIGDWKSTNRSSSNIDGISVEYFFQCGALAQAEFERTGKWVDDVFVANFDKEGGEPRVVWASEFGASPQDCAKAYLSCFMNYHTIKEWEYKYLKK